VGGLFVAAAVGWLGRLRPSFRARDLIFLPFAGLYLIYALAPPIAADAIGYHLGLATEWLRAGTFVRPAVGFYDVLPHGMETLFMAAAAIGGLTAATLVQFVFLLATIPLILAIGDRLGFDGHPAALIYFATPVVGITGTAAYVDAALVFYTLATFWLLLEDKLALAGLTAGFCYAIKMSAGPAVLAVCLYLLLRRSWRGIALAAAMIVPWLAHAWRLSGNPVAPMLPRLFPSPAFYPEVVADWTEYVRSYAPWREQWWEVTVGGARSQGLLGPVFLLAPLALLGPRRRPVLLLVAGVCAMGWLFNNGTRFLMPAAPFVALALTAAIPRPAAWALALAQAVLCWPAVLDRYVPSDAWRLPSAWPWRAALRIEPAPAYLARANFDYLLAAMVNRHVRRKERVLDFGEVPRGYVHGAEMLASWQYTPARRAVVALLKAQYTLEREPMYLLRSKWPRRRLRSLRIELLAPGADPWSIQEVRLWRAGERVLPSRAWELDAWPIPWEAPLAFDRNDTSSWQTWEPRRAGMHFEITGSMDVDTIELVNPAAEEQPKVRLTGLSEQGAAVDLPAPERAVLAAPLNLRRPAMRYLYREGFRWILIQRNSPDHRLGKALVDDAFDWGLEIADETNGVVLLRIVNP
jgi:hypothetical protein